jgi:glutamate racemase
LRIGVFDSGIGGLTVCKSLIEHNLFSEIVYYGDTARVPYGSKDKNTIIRYSLDAVEFFKNFYIDMLITACNTVSSYAITEMREKISIPVVGVIEPGVASLEKLNLDKNVSILVIATKATISSQMYQQSLVERGYKNITSIPTPLFVPMVEEGIFEGELLDKTIEYYLSNIKNPDVIILGCTHFPLIANSLKKFFPNSILVHSGEAIVDYLITNYNIKISSKKTKLRLFASENPSSLKAIADK